MAKKKICERFALANLLFRSFPLPGGKGGRGDGRDDSYRMFAKENKKPDPVQDPVSVETMRALNWLDVGGLQALGTLLDRELHFLILLQAFIAFHLDG